MTGIWVILHHEHKLSRSVKLREKKKKPEALINTVEPQIRPTLETVLFLEVFFFFTRDNTFLYLLKSFWIRFSVSCSQKHPNEKDRQVKKDWLRSCLSVNSMHRSGKYKIERGTLSCSLSLSILNIFFSSLKSYKNNMHIIIKLCKRVCNKKKSPAAHLLSHSTLRKLLYILSKMLLAFWGFFSPK